MRLSNWGQVCVCQFKMICVVVRVKGICGHWGKKDCGNWTVRSKGLWECKGTSVCQENMDQVYVRVTWTKCLSG